MNRIQGEAGSTGGSVSVRQTAVEKDGGSVMRCVKCLRQAGIAEAVDRPPSPPPVGGKRRGRAR